MIRSKDIDYIVDFSDSQNSLLNALAEQDDRLKSMYYGSLIVLNSKQNPERLQLAAHGIRELIEKIPKYLSVSINDHDSNGAFEYSLKQQVNELKDSWDKNVAHNTSFDRNKVIGDIDQKVQRFLIKCQSFFENYQSERPTRSQEMANVLLSMDKSSHILPEALQKKNIRILTGLRDYFQGVSHHAIPCTEEDEFYSQLEKLEGFLLDRLVPRIFADFDEIDRIIQEVNVDD